MGGGGGGVHEVGALCMGGYMRLGHSCMGGGGGGGGYTVLLNTCIDGMQ